MAVDPDQAARRFRQLRMVMGRAEAAQAAGIPPPPPPEPAPPRPAPIVTTIVTGTKRGGAITTSWLQPDGTTIDAAERERRRSLPHGGRPCPKPPGRCVACSREAAA